MTTIAWSEENIKTFGLDYSTLKGNFEMFDFDIRYDYDGKANEKPINCNLYLNIIFKNKIIARKSSTSIDDLKNYCIDFMQTLQGVFLNAKFN